MPYVGNRRFAIRPDRRASEECGCVYTEAFHRLYDRGLPYFSLYDACRLSLRITANRKANVAAESGQHRQRVHYPG